jgi:hypothetical protein
MTKVSEQFDDRTVLGILSQVTADLHEQLPKSETSAIASLSDARAAIAALLEQQGAGSVEPESIFPEDQPDPVVGRHILDLLLTDSETKEAAAEAVANPPTDSQKSVELAIAGAVILGSLTAWLQTSVEVQMHRKGGKLDFSFRLKKGATGGKTLADVAEIVAKLIP